MYKFAKQVLSVFGHTRKKKIGRKLLTACIELATDEWEMQYAYVLNVSRSCTTTTSNKVHQSIFRKILQPRLEL